MVQHFYLMTTWQRKSGWRHWGRAKVIFPWISAHWMDPGSLRLFDFRRRRLSQMARKQISLLKPLKKAQNHSILSINPLTNEVNECLRWYQLIIILAVLPLDQLMTMKQNGNARESRYFRNIWRLWIKLFETYFLKEQLSSKHFFYIFSSYLL